MSQLLTVIATAQDRCYEIPLSGLTPVGGRKSSGFAIEGLKHDGDYLVLAPTDDGISIHPLRGGRIKAGSLRNGQACRIDDLTLSVRLAAPAATRAEPTAAEAATLPAISGILDRVASQDDTRAPLEAILQAVMETCGHLQGLVISQGVQGEYEVLVSRNLDRSQPWLSESLVQQALASREPVIIQNLVGSGFDTKQSLIATKFLSVFCWPLLVQGRCRGVLISGSRAPSSGSFAQVRDRASVYVNLGALVLDFHLRELRLKHEIGEIKAQRTAGPFLTKSPALLQVGELARKISGSDLSVLIQGETGVGKEVLSRWIHEQSPRRSGPFVAVNCAAIPAELLESVLFGHRKGSFTGALADHTGKFQQANGGTLFLDEIGDLPAALQAKLLRALQERAVDPVGGTKSIPVDIRLLCASHRNIPQLARAGQFRDDLFYRLAQVTLTIPPLRERLADVRLLAKQFLAEIGSGKSFAPDAWTWMLSQPWPGNARELLSAIQRAAVLADGAEIQARDFVTGTAPNDASPEDSAPDLETAKQLFVMKKINQALEQTQGNRTRAAELLGVTSRTLFRYLENRGPSGMTDTS